MSKRVNNKQINKVKYNLQQAGDILLVYLIDEFLNLFDTFENEPDGNKIAARFIIKFINQMIEKQKLLDYSENDYKKMMNLINERKIVKQDTKSRDEIQMINDFKDIGLEIDVSPENIYQDIEIENDFNYENQMGERYDEPSNIKNWMNLITDDESRVNVFIVKNNNL